MRPNCHDDAGEGEKGSCGKYEELHSQVTSRITNAQIQAAASLASTFNDSKYPLTARDASAVVAAALGQRACNAHRRCGITGIAYRITESHESGM